MKVLISHNVLDNTIQISAVIGYRYVPNGVSLLDFCLRRIIVILLGILVSFIAHVCIFPRSGTEHVSGTRGGSI